MFPIKKNSTVNNTHDSNPMRERTLERMHHTFIRENKMKILTRKTSIFFVSIFGFFGRVQVKPQTILDLLRKSIFF